MYIFGQIVDSITKQPLRSASVVVLNNLYIPKLIGTLTGVDGYFDLNNNSIQESDKLLITFTEYKPLTISVSDVLYAMDIFPDNGGLWGLTPNIKDLPPVVITTPPKKKKGTGIALAALLLLALASDKKKGRSVSGAETTATFIEKHWTLLLIGGGIVLLWPTIRNIFSGLGSLSDVVKRFLSIPKNIIESAGGIVEEEVYRRVLKYVSAHNYDPKQLIHLQNILDDKLITQGQFNYLLAVWKQPKTALDLAGWGANG